MEKYSFDWRAVSEATGSNSPLNMWQRRKQPSNQRDMFHFLHIKQLEIAELFMLFH